MFLAEFYYIDADFKDRYFIRLVAAGSREEAQEKALKWWKKEEYKRSDCTLTEIEVSAPIT